jgi:hypothetical protein
MRCSDTRRSIAHAGDVCTHGKGERLGVGGRCSGWRRGIRGWEAERRGGGPGQLRVACVIGAPPPVYYSDHAHRSLVREPCAREAHDDRDETVTKQRDAAALRDLSLGEIGRDGAEGCWGNLPCSAPCSTPCATPWALPRGLCPHALPPCSAPMLCPHALPPC